MKIQVAFVCILTMSFAPVQLTAGPPGMKGGFGGIRIDDVGKSAANEIIKPKKKPRHAESSNKNSNNPTSTARAKKPRIGYRSIWSPVAH